MSDLTQQDDGISIEMERSCANGKKLCRQDGTTTCGKKKDQEGGRTA